MNKAALAASATLAFLYVLFGVAWILLSDEVVQLLSRDPGWLQLAQRYKGLFFVGLTSLLLMGVVYRSHCRLLASARRVAERDLRISDLFKQHPVPMWVYDRQTLAFLSVNDAAVARYGYSRAEFLAMTIRDIRPPEDLPRLATQPAPRTHSGFGDAGLWRHLTRSGELLHVRITVHALEFQGRQADLILSMDVTAEVQARDDLTRLNDTLEQRVQRRTQALELANAELEAFARTVAHDLKTPLNGIAGLTQLLQIQARQAGNPQALALLDRMASASQAMARLIDDLLVLSRVSLSEVRRETVSLSGLARQLMAEMQATAPQRGLDLMVAEDMVVQADAGLLRALLVNLLGNAWKYSGKRERSLIEVAPAGQLKGVPVWVVRDNGAGFPMDQAARLFEPFQRLHSADEFSGTGIGLATCQRIVRRHGGSLWAESQPGVGSSFYFTLGTGQPVPASPGLVAGAAGGASTRAAAPGRLVKC